MCWDTCGQGHGPCCPIVIHSLMGEAGSRAGDI